MIVWGILLVIFGVIMVKKCHAIYAVTVILTVWIIQMNCLNIVNIQVLIPGFSS